jgi:hypothetical protein
MLQFIEGATVGFKEIPWILEMMIALGGGALALTIIGVRSVSEMQARSSAIKTAFVYTLALVVGNALLLTAVAPSLSLKNWLSTSDVVQRAELKREEFGYSYENESYDVSFYLQRPFRRVETKGCPESGILVLQSRNLERYKVECGSNVTFLGSYTPLGESPGKSIMIARVSR